MARSIFRAQGPTESRQRSAHRRVIALSIATTLTGCVSYEPAPVDLAEILRDLEALQWTPSEIAGSSDAVGATPERLAAFAVTHNPSLRAVRSDIDVAEALLVEAGLLADPGIGWDGMDALASQIVDNTATSVDFLSGFGLSITIPRPGELDAKEGAARWRAEEVRRRVTRAEWTLARDVFVACEDVLEAERLLAQNQTLVQVAETTRDYFERARGAGAATAIQDNLASGDLLAIRAERIRLESRLRKARHRLNALLGLPPSLLVPIVPTSEHGTAPNDASFEPEALVERSLSLRPDLAELLAAYQAAEERVRIEVARQFPRLSIGTGIWLVPGFFSDFNRPAIETARARREALRRKVAARLHEARREIHDAHAAVEESRRELGFLQAELLPNAEESRRLIGEAFDEGEVTLLEILSVHRDLVRARTRTTEVRAELERRRWRLAAASGTLFAALGQETNEDEENESTIR